MHQKRIKVLLYTVSLGGVLRHIQDIVTQIDHTKFELIGVFPDKLLNKAYLPHNISGYHSIFTAAGLKSYTVETPVGLNPLASTTAFYNMARLLRHAQPDVLHCHSSMAGAIGRLATLAWRPRRVLYTPHLMYCLRSTGLRRFIFSAIERILFPLTDTVIAVSDSELHDISSIFGQNHRLTLIRNAVPVDLSAPATQPGGSALPKDIKPLQGKKIILSTARFDAQKDVPTLIHAAHILAQTRSDFQVLLAGDGEDRDAIRARIRDRKLEHLVHLLGWRSDVPQLLAACDVMVLSTHREGLPYAMLEAMALGKPVIGSDVPGVRECVEHGQTGFLFPCGNAQALAELLTQVLDNAALRQKIGAQAQHAILHRFSPRSMMTALEALYSGTHPVPEAETTIPSNFTGQH